jgi:hypothetical protein
MIRSRDKKNGRIVQLCYKRRERKEDKKEKMGHDSVIRKKEKGSV